MTLFLRTAAPQDFNLDEIIEIRPHAENSIEVIYKGTDGTIFAELGYFIKP